MESAQDGTEHAVRSAFDRGDIAGATTLVIERYGPDVLGFLVARLASRTRAAEVFSTFCEDLWRGLPGFRWECSARGFSYALARNAARRHLADEGRRRERNVQWDTSAWAREPVRAHTRTEPFLQTPVRDRLQALRTRLAPEDQSLLILRVARKLSWRELAVVFGEPDRGVSGVELEREAARLRKRFSLATAKLRQWAREDGLLPPSDE